MPFARHATLTAGVVSSFTVTGNPAAVEVLSRNGLAEVYVSYDGTGTPADPTIGGDDFDVVPAAVGAFVVLPDLSPSTPANVVKVRSASATTISVRGIQ